MPLRLRAERGDDNPVATGPALNVAGHKIKEIAATEVALVYARDAGESRQVKHRLEVRRSKFFEAGGANQPNKRRL